MQRFIRPSQHFESSGSSIDTTSLFSNVLLIEDEHAHATLISRALRDVVGEIRHVETGKKGLELLSSEFCELVFCDLQLPDMSGMEVIAEIKRARPTLPIVVLTSSSDLRDAVDAMREGAWDFMLKQFSGELSAQIRLVVERTAERKMQQLREMEALAERDAFWVAAFTAQDGLAILGEGGRVVFDNEAFNNFHQLFDDYRADPHTVNIVKLIAEFNTAVAEDLQKELVSLSPDSLWSSELELPVTDPDGSTRSRFFDLTLSAASRRGFDSDKAKDGLVPQLRYRVLWIRETTRRKDQERFQRDLLSTTTHDLKGPLSAILTSAELIGECDASSSDKAQSLLTRIASCARNAISIIDELLSARRIQDGVLVVKPRWYPVQEIVEDAVLDYLPMAKSKEIDFTARPASAELKVFADRLTLNRVIGNLVSNAIKFTPKGGKVELAVKRTATATQIAVIDNGPGIEAEARHKLFARFSRLEKHADIEGTGLGLFVSKNIMDAHNGRIEVRSTVGKGTTFFVTFPDGPKEEKSTA